MTASTSQSADVRFFDNPFKDYTKSNEGYPSINKALVRTNLMEIAKHVFARPKHECRGGVYVGAAGLTYSYLHMIPILTEGEKHYYTPLAQKLYSRHYRYFQDLGNSLKERDLPAFLHGKAGFDAVGSVLGSVTGDHKLFKISIRNFANAAHICLPANFQKRGSDELFVGRAGYLLGILWLQQKLGPGFDPVAEHDVRDIWTAMVKSGRRYAKDHDSPCPLMYSYHETEYLGAAHGLSSILQVLLSFPEFLRQDRKTEQQIQETIDFILSTQDKFGNFPSTIDKSDQNILVQWCHGAPGVIYMFAKAYLVWGDEKYLKACVQCGECVWRFGLLRKGPGLCHGVAGNGYVFLLLHRLLHENSLNGKYLHRAMKFAEFLKHPEYTKSARVPDRPYSLFEGLAGTICFLADLLRPEEAEFPFFNVFYNYILP